MQNSSLVNSSVIQKFVNEVLECRDVSKEQLLRTLEQTELKIADMVQSNPYLVANRHTIVAERLNVPAQSATKSPSLIIPKGNSLTDSLLKSTLGCQDKLAKEYQDICRRHNDDQIRQASIAEIKKKFSESNSFKDFYANMKAHSQPTKNVPKPLIDNEHEEYLKTQLMFLEKPKTLNESITYHNKKLKNVATKIEELGGIEDTIKNMEQTLKSNEIQKVSRNQTYEMGASPRHRSPMATKINSASVVFDGLSKSRKMRSALMEADRNWH